MEITLFYVPFPTREEANIAIECLLNEKLIACAQILSTQSHYVWEGVNCQEDEFPVILKTDSRKTYEVETKLNDLHSYDIPAILHWKASVNEAYGKWVADRVDFKMV